MLDITGNKNNLKLDLFYDIISLQRIFLCYTPLA